jgi:hypothetical protein
VLAALGFVIHVNSVIHVRDADNVRETKARKALHNLTLKLVIGKRLVLARPADFSTLDPLAAEHALYLIAVTAALI